MIIKIDFNSDEAIYVQLRNQIVFGIATASSQQTEHHGKYQKDGENLFHLINPHWRLWMLQLHVQISAEVRSDRQLV